MFGAANSRRVPKSMVRAYTIEQVAVTNRSGFSSVRNGHFLREHFKTGLREKPTRFRLMGRPHGLNPLKFGLEPKDRPRSYFLVRQFQQDAIRLKLRPISWGRLIGEIEAFVNAIAG